MEILHWLRKLVGGKMQDETLFEGDIVAWMQGDRIAHAAISVSLQGEIHLFHASTNSPLHVAAGAERAYSGVMLTSAMDEICAGRATECVVYRPYAESDTLALRDAVRGLYGERMPDGAKGRFHSFGVDFAKRILSLMGHDLLLRQDATFDPFLARRIGTVQCVMARPSQASLPPLTDEERKSARVEVGVLLEAQWEVAQRV